MSLSNLFRERSREMEEKSLCMHLFYRSFPRRWVLNWSRSISEWQYHVSIATNNRCEKQWCAKVRYNPMVCRSFASIFNPFLVASSHLYMKVCPFVVPTIQHQQNSSSQRNSEFVDESVRWMVEVENYASPPVCLFVHLNAHVLCWARSHQLYPCETFLCVLVPKNYIGASSFNQRFKEAKEEEEQRIAASSSWEDKRGQAGPAISNTHKYGHKFKWSWCQVTRGRELEAQRAAHVQGENLFSNLNRLNHP